MHGILTGFSGWHSSFFLQDSTGAAISVDRRDTTDVKVGEEVEVLGSLRAGLYAPILLSEKIQIVAQRQLPAPLEMDYLRLSEPSADSKYVEVIGVLHYAHKEEMWGKQVVYLGLQMHGGMVPVYVQDAAASTTLSNLVDSTVRIKGVCGAVFDRSHFTGARLFVSGLDQVEVISPGKSLDELPISQTSILGSYTGPPVDHRVKLSGIVTYQSDSVEFYLQDGETAIRVRSSISGKWSPGQRVTAAGFLDTSTSLYTLTAAKVHVLGSSRPIPPVKISAEDVIHIENGFASAPYNGRLVEVSGRIVDLVPTGQGQLFQLRAGPVSFEAQLPSVTESHALGLERDSKVELKGICLIADQTEGRPQSFRIVLRSSDDIRITDTPDGRTSLLLLIIILGFVLGGTAVLWFLSERRKLDDSHDDTDNQLSPRPSQLLSLARILGSVNLFVGTIVVIGWILDIRLLELGDVHNRMMPNTALGILSAGLSIRLLNRSSGLGAVVRKSAAVACGFVGLVSLMEDVTGINFGIDQLLIRNSDDVNSYFAPGHIPVATSLCLMLLALSILLLLSRQRRLMSGIGQAVALAAGVIALLNMLANVYGSYARFGVGAHATMAFLAATTIVTLSLAVLFASPDQGFMRTIVSAQNGGLLARRLIPVVMVLPILLGWVRLQGQLAGLYDTRFGVALFTLSSIVCFGFVVWNCAALLNNLDRARASAEQEVRKRDKHLRGVLHTALVGDWTWDVEKDEVSAHPVVWDLYGAPGHTACEPSSWFRQRQHPDDVEFVEALTQAAFKEQRGFDLEFRVVQANGSIRWICCRGHAVTDETGKWVRSSGINFDITDRKEAEGQLRNSEERFRQLADAMPQIVWTAAPDGSIDYYNKRCTNTLNSPLNHLGKTTFIQSMSLTLKSIFQNLSQKKKTMSQKYD